jgi:hypothetical protein
MSEWKPRNEKDFYRVWITKAIRQDARFKSLLSEGILF